MAKYYIEKKTHVVKRNILGKPLEVLDHYYIYRRRGWFKKEYLNLRCNILDGRYINTPWGYDALMEMYQEKIKGVEEGLRSHFDGYKPFREYPISWEKDVPVNFLSKEEAEYVLEDIISNPNYYINYYDE